jgi:hypothetical protein
LNCQQYIWYPCMKWMDGRVKLNARYGELAYSQFIATNADLIYVRNISDLPTSSNLIISPLFGLLICGTFVKILQAVYSKDLAHFIKSIVMSGYSDDPVMSNFSQYGFSGVLKKPCAVKAFL